MFRLSALGHERFWSPAHRPRVNDWYRRLSARPAFENDFLLADGQTVSLGVLAQTRDMTRDVKYKRHLSSRETVRYLRRKGTRLGAAPPWPAGACHWISVRHALRS